MKVRIIIYFKWRQWQLLRFMCKKYPTISPIYDSCVLIMKFPTKEVRFCQCFVFTMLKWQCVKWALIPRQRYWIWQCKMSSARVSQDTEDPQSRRNKSKLFNVQHKAGVIQKAFKWKSFRVSYKLTSIFNTINHVLKKCIMLIVTVNITFLKCMHKQTYLLYTKYKPLHNYILTSREWLPIELSYE